METEISTLAAELLALESRRQETSLESAESDRHQELLEELFQRLHHAPGAERRRYLRIPADLEAKFRLGQATITCGANELSMGGLSLRGHLWVIEDEELLLENLRVGTRDYPTAIRVRVIWKISDEDQRPRAGLQFVDLDDNGRRQVRAIYEQLFLGLLKRLATE